MSSWAPHASSQRESSLRNSPALVFEPGASTDSLICSGQHNVSLFYNSKLLSRLEQGFESPWGRQLNQMLMSKPLLIRLTCTKFVQKAGRIGLRRVPELHSRSAHVST